jgi:hypothetical protein
MKFDLLVWFRERKIMLTKRMLFTVLVCLIVSSCASPQVTATTLIPTFTAQPTNTALPENIVEGASLSGLSPDEIVSFYLEIRSYIESGNVGALADKIQYPIRICGLHNGDVIEARDEFVQKYDYAFEDYWREYFLNQKLEHARIGEYGVSFERIAYSKIWSDSEHHSYAIRIIRIGNYCYVDPIKESNQATAEAATPEYSGNSFIFGMYKVILHERVGGTMLTQGEIDGVQTIVIAKEVFSSDEVCRRGYACSCNNPGYEFHKPTTGKGTAESYGLGSQIGQLIVVCNGLPNAYFDILANDQIGFYYDGNYWIFKHQ